MISVGGRDARKGLEIGLGFASGAEMDESELEEGEACSYQNDDDPTVDPDVALSYIDEKLQDVLGHFQKEFEGGVSAENLGAKFGGYGSFLPTYQRSPVWSHLRSPKKGGVLNSQVPSRFILLSGHGEASENDAPLPPLKASDNDFAKRKVIVSAHCVEKSNLRCEFGKSCGQPSDEKMVKVHINVGSDNLSAQKNAEIYSGLGLDISPSSSLEENPSDREESHHESQDAQDESPSRILQIMTSFPVHENLLLSPLPEDLINLTEKQKKLQRESKPRFSQKPGKESSNVSDPVKNDGKVLRGKKQNSRKKDIYSVELKNLDVEDTHNEHVLLKKETDTDTLACEKLVTNALKLPLLSKSLSNCLNIKNTTNGEISKRVAVQEVNVVEKPIEKVASASEFCEDKKLDFCRDIDVNLKEDTKLKEEKAVFPIETESNVPKGRKARNAEFIDDNATFLKENDMKLAFGKEHLSFGSNKKFKGSQSHNDQGTEVSKEMSQMDSSWSINEVEGPKLLGDNVKALNRYKDFFGDMELDQGDNDAYSTDMNPIDKGKDNMAASKCKFASNSSSEKRLNVKKGNRRYMSEANSKSAFSAAPISGIAGPLVKEDWVCCDKCQTWRLLPLGTNPDSLPEKWICSMLDWLPGMNRCEFSEEETTKALVALCQNPATENFNQHGPPGGDLVGPSSADTTGVKKNDGAKDINTPLSQGVHTQITKSSKKNLQAAVENRSLNGETRSSKSKSKRVDDENSSGVSKKMRSLEEQNDFGDARLLSTPKRCMEGEDGKGDKIETHRESLDFCVLDFKKRDMGHLAGGQAKLQIEHSPGFANSDFVNGGSHTLANSSNYPSKLQTSSPCLDREKGREKQCQANGSHPRKSSKGSSSRAKEENGSFRSEVDKERGKIYESGNESADHRPAYEEISRVNSNKVEKEFASKKESAGKVARENYRRESQSKYGKNNGLDVKVDPASSQDQKQNLRFNQDERSSGKHIEKGDRTEVSEKGKPQSLPPSGRSRTEAVTHSLHLNPEGHKENKGSSLSTDASGGDNALKAPKQVKESTDHNRNEPIKSRRPTSNGHRDVNAPSPARRDSSSHMASNALKEAKDLKHLADRLKNTGSSAERTGLYFQAALKFLHGASLLEYCGGESAKHGETIQYMEVYSSTAKLCGFCAHEYEKSKDLATAALAYKCMEVAYMRVIYCSHRRASRDRLELQAASQIVPPGESPSSSASDVDNINNPTSDKVSAKDVVNSPQVGRNHRIISAGNRPSFIRLLNYAQDVNFAMEASKKSRVAFAAANSRTEEAQYRDGIASVKRALDFNFQDMEGLLRLVSEFSAFALGRRIGKGECESVLRAYASTCCICRSTNCSNAGCFTSPDLSGSSGGEGTLQRKSASYIL